MAHDLHDFVSQLSAKMDSEYQRIRKSATKDPGTAGAEGEENWAQLLRDWLPRSYQIVTKGQMLFDDGALSPQIDILVLKPSYPPALHHKKKYLAAGVAAAFECKLTLKKDHIFKTVETAAFVKRMADAREGTPYRELTAEPVFGLLSHSHSWTSDKAAATHSIDRHFVAADQKHAKHPREVLDFICVSDLATWVSSKHPLADPDDEIDPIARAERDPAGSPETNLMCHRGEKSAFGEFDPNFRPLGVFIAEFLVKLAWEDASLRDIAQYFARVEFSTAAAGRSRFWTKSVYSKGLRRKLKLRKFTEISSWDEWAPIIE